MKPKPHATLVLEFSTDGRFESSSAGDMHFLRDALHALSGILMADPETLEAVAEGRAKASLDNLWASPGDSHKSCANRETARSTEAEEWINARLTAAAYKAQAIESELMRTKIAVRRVWGLLGTIDRRLETDLVGIEQRFENRLNRMDQRLEDLEYPDEP